MKLYLSGPITGMPDKNRPLFAAEAARLRALGYEVVSPHELGFADDDTWEHCMRGCIKALMDCDVIVLLPGWADSRGAGKELQAAGWVGIKSAFAAKVHSMGCLEGGI